MTINDKKSMLENIFNLKKDLFKMRIKKTSGDNVNPKEIRETKKQIARIFTQLNAKK